MSKITTASLLVMIMIFLSMSAIAGDFNYECSSDPQYRCDVIVNDANVREVQVYNELMTTKIKGYCKVIDSRELPNPTGKKWGENYPWYVECKMSGKNFGMKRTNIPRESGSRFPTSRMYPDLCKFVGEDVCVEGEWRPASN